MASRREQVSALFFVAWTQRRLTQRFPWATEGPYPPKETLTFKKEFFWQTTSGSLPAGLKSSERSSTSTLIMNAREQICAVLASANFRTLSKSQSSWLWTACSRTARLSQTKQHALDFLHFRFTFLVVFFFFFFATTNQARQLSFTVECVRVCIVCRVCVWGLFAQAEPSISESPRRGQNESYPLSPLGHRHYSAEWRLLQVFFFRESPWAGLQGILVNLGLSKGLLAATLTQCFWPTNKHDICSSFNWKRIDRVLLPWSSTPWLRPALIITTARKVKRAGTLQERTAKGMSQVVDQLGRNWFDRSSAVSTSRESCSMH